MHETRKTKKRSRDGTAAVNKQMRHMRPALVLLSTCSVPTRIEWKTSRLLPRRTTSPNLHGERLSIQQQFSCFQQRELEHASTDAGVYFVGLHVLGVAV